MAVDYDVVIIGGSLAARYAAIAATQFGATVALIEPHYEQGATMQSPSRDRLMPHALSQIGQVKLSDAAQFGVQFSPAAAVENCVSVGWAETMQWALSVSSNIEEQYSPAVLASLGVDVIFGNGEFHLLPHLAFTVNQRSLRARAYLIATSSRPVIPDIEGLQTTGYLTPSEVWQQLNSQKPPSNWVIIGSDPSGCQWAQTLTRLGFNVTLIVRRSNILVKEDPEAAYLVQATLEAEGVRVLTQTSVVLVKQIQDKKWIQAGNEAIETDEILLAAGQVSNVESLNLEAVGVKFNRRGIVLNENLQTTNRRIYALSNVIGGYHANIANYEATIALKNALFFPVFKADYTSIPWAIFSDPTLARVGLTEPQARRQYNDDILILRQYFKTLATAQLQNELTGICKLMVRRNGEIVGATIVGAQAGELIHVIALAMRQRLHVSAIAQLAPVYPTMSEILAQTAATWNQQRRQSNTQLQFLESFFNFRRSWSK